MPDVPIRVLHVFGRLNRTGGAEKWVLDMLRCGDPAVQFDFLVGLDGPDADEARRRGSTVYRVPFSRSPIPCPWGNSYLAGVRRVLRNERFNAIHLHQFDLSGEILRIAAEEGIAVRVMSVHATEYENPRWYRRVVHRVWGRPWIFRHATAILPCSRAVAETWAPLNRENGPTVRVLYTGIDPAVFREALNRRLVDFAETGSVRAKYCREFGIPANATVVGHIGRFTRQKNHGFLIDRLDAMMLRDPDLYAVLVGGGERLEAMRRRVAKKGRQDRIILPGIRDDVPDLTASLFDVFLLPSLYEGLPIVGIEALACGLGLVMSDRVSDELTPFFPDRVIRLPLEAASERWDRAVREMIAAKADPVASLNRLEETPFTVRASLDRLISVYREGLQAEKALSGPVGVLANISAE